MSIDKDNAADGVLQTVEKILESGMRNLDVTLANRRRLAGDLAIYPVDAEAFDTAVDAFDSEYGRLWDTSYGDEASHYDATISALALFLKTYLEEASQP